MKISELRLKHTVIFFLVSLILIFLLDLQMGSPLFPGRVVEGEVIGTVDRDAYGRNAKVPAEFAVVSVVEAGQEKEYEILKGFKDWTIGSKVELKITNFGIAQKAGVVFGFGAFVVLLFLILSLYLTAVGVKQSLRNWLQPNCVGFITDKEVLISYANFMAMNMHVKRAAKNLARAESDKLREAKEKRAEIVRKEAEMKREVESRELEISQNEREMVYWDDSIPEYAHEMAQIRSMKKEIDDLKSNYEKEKQELEQQANDLENEARGFKRQADDLSKQA